MSYIRVACLLIMTTISFVHGASAASCPAEPIVQRASEAFTAAARSRSPQAFVNAAARFADLRWIAFFALGSHRRDLPKAKERLYLSRSKDFMGRFMAEYSKELSGGRISIRSCTRTANGYLVTGRSEGGTSLSFRVRGTSRIDDVRVSGIWIVLAMRNKFHRIIDRNHGDVNGLIDELGR